MLFIPLNKVLINSVSVLVCEQAALCLFTTSRAFFNPILFAVSGGSKNENKSHATGNEKKGVA
jgi:hypothetical protein